MGVPNVLIDQILDSELPDNPVNSGYARIIYRQSTNQAEIILPGNVILPLGAFTQPVEILSSGTRVITQADDHKLFFVTGTVNIELQPGLTGYPQFEILCSNGGSRATLITTGGATLLTETGFTSLTGTGKRGQVILTDDTSHAWLATGQFSTSNIFDSLPGLGWLFDPNDAGSLVLNGSTVASMGNLAGTGWSPAAQGSANAQPTLASGILNGADVLDFDGGDYMQFGAPEQFMNKTDVPHLTFVIARSFQANSTTSRRIFEDNDNGDEYLLINRFTNGSRRVEQEFNDNRTNTIHDYANWTVYGLRRNANGNVMTDINGVQSITSGVVAQHNRSGPLRIGGNSNRFIGQIRMFGFYDQELISNERDLLYGELKNIAGI